MPEYIEREVGDNSLCEVVREYNRKKMGNEAVGAFEALDRFRRLPAADVRPVKRGKWRLGGYGQISDATVKWYDQFLTGGFFYCSVCKERSSSKTNFCPNCGADMQRRAGNG